MLRAIRVLRAVSPYTIFLIDQKKNAALKGMPIGSRGKALAKLYKQLSANKKKELRRRAAKYPSVNKMKARRRSGPRKTIFSEFVRKNYDVVKGLNYMKRFAALSQLHELRKPVTVEGGKAKSRARVTSAKSALGRAAKK